MQACGHGWSPATSSSSWAGGLRRPRTPSGDCPSLSHRPAWRTLDVRMRPRAGVNGQVVVPGGGQVEVPPLGLLRSCSCGCLLVCGPATTIRTLLRRYGLGPAPRGSGPLGRSSCERRPRRSSRATSSPSTRSGCGGCVRPGDWRLRPLSPEEVIGSTPVSPKATPPAGSPALNRQGTRRRLSLVWVCSRAAPARSKSGPGGAGSSALPGRSVASPGRRPAAARSP
jgi:hypothetical protein